GATGFEVAELLREESDIHLELRSEHILVAVFGVGEPVADSCQRLVQGLEIVTDQLARRPPELTRATLAPVPRWGPLSMSPRAAWAWLAVGTCLAIAYFFQHGPVGHHIFYDGIGLSAVAVSVYGIHRNRPRVAKAWYLIAVGQLAFVCGDLIRAYYEIVVGGSAPFPGLSDILYVPPYP